MSFASRFKLSAMMFLQFMLVAAFWVQLSSYLDNMKVSGLMFSLIMSTMAIGSIFSPLVGMFADRVANSEKVLAILNFFVAILLLATFFTSNPILIFIFLMLAMCAYMPTWGLTSSIAMTNSTPEAFPYIRVFGSLGWVCAAVFALGAKAIFDISIDGTNIPLACAAGVALVAAVFSLFLPATPPKAKGEPMSITDALGLRAFGMLKDANISIFMICVVVWTIAFTIYWMYGSFLASLGVKEITPVLNIGQISELAFMVAIPVSIKFLGFKNTMAIGILAMFLRYVMSALSPEVGGLYFGAIAVHGAIFGFFFVAAQMYIDKKAPADIKAQAQGLYFFFYGVAQVIGTFFSKWLIDSYTVLPAQAGAEAVTNWATVFWIESAISGALLIFFYLFFKNDVKEQQ